MTVSNTQTKNKVQTSCKGRNAQVIKEGMDIDIGGADGRMGWKSIGNNMNNPEENPGNENSNDIKL